MPFIGNIGPGELIIILIIALVVFGPGKLPEVGQALGKGIREFRRAATDVTEATRVDTSAPAPAPVAAATPPPTPPAAPPVVAPPAAVPAATAVDATETEGAASDPGQPAA